MVDPAHAVLAGELVKIVNQLDPILFLTVQGYGLAMIEGDFDLLGLVGCMPRVDCPLKSLGRGLDTGIFQNPGLDRAAPEILVGAENRLSGGLDLDAVRGGELELPAIASTSIPAPGQRF